MARISVVPFNYPFVSSPSIINLTRDLRRNHDLIVYIYTMESTDIPDDLKNSVKAFKYVSNQSEVTTRKHGESVKTKLKYLLPHKMRNYLRQQIYYASYPAKLLGYYKWCRDSIRSSEHVIAVEKLGLLVCALARKKPSAYYSLEAVPLRETRFGLAKLGLAFERYYLRRWQVNVVSQTPERFAILDVKDRCRVAYIPVTAGIGALPRSNYLRTLLPIPSEKKIVLLVGLSADFCALPILRMVRTWTEEVVLVIHARGGRYPREILEECRKTGISNRVFFTRTDFTIDDAEKYIFASADIGIVQYQDLNENYRRTAYSSGKLAAFTRSGVPMIVPEFEEFCGLLNKHRLGVTATPSTIALGIDTILKKYDYFSRESLEAYQKIFSYMNYEGLIESMFLESTSKAASLLSKT